MNFDINTILYSLPAVIIGLTVHEFAHAYVAYRLGDSTAKDQGRLTLNPIRHIDPLGFVFIVLAGFGWAKPVRFTPENLKHPRRDKALIALAGPVSNLLLGILFLIVLKLFLAVSAPLSESVYQVLVKLQLYMIYINLGLFIFNILPIPPLDGSHIFFSGVNIKPETEAILMKYGSYVLIMVLFIESSAKIDIIPIGKLTNMIVGLFF